MEYKKRHDINELNLEVALERELMDANQSAEERDIRLKCEKMRLDRAEMKQAMNEQRLESTHKHKRAAVEKEDSQRKIQELVDEENGKIAVEEAEKRRQRDALADEYHKFIKTQEQKKEDRASAEKEHEARLNVELYRIFDRQDDEKRKQKATVDARIKVQEEVGNVTAQLLEAEEKKLKAYLTANEQIASANACLAEYDSKAEQLAKKQRDAIEGRGELIKLMQFKKKLREEELMEERALDKMNMEFLDKQADKRAAEIEEKRKKEREEFQKYADQRKQCIAEDYAEIVRAERKYLDTLKAKEELVAVEREAMLAEYAHYMDYLVKCPPEQDRIRSGN